MPTSYSVIIFYMIGVLQAFSVITSYLIFQGNVIHVSDYMINAVVCKVCVHSTLEVAL